MNCIFLSNPNISDAKIVIGSVLELPDNMSFRFDITINGRTNSFFSLIYYENIRNDTRMQILDKAFNQIFNKLENWIKVFNVNTELLELDGATIVTNGYSIKNMII